MRSRSVVVLLLLAMVGLGLVGCDGDDGPADVDPTETGVPQSVDGMRLEVYEDDRLSFVYPEDWEVEVAEGDEQRVRVEKRESGSESAEAVILASWPFLAAAVESDLDRLIRQFGRESEEPEIIDFEQRPVDVPGADEAALQRFTHTDWVIGEEITAQTWTVFAISAVGRPMYFGVGVRQDSDIDGEALAETVISSLELKDPWGS